VNTTNCGLAVHGNVAASGMRFSDDRWFGVYKAPRCPSLCWHFSFLFYLHILDIAIDMDSLQPTLAMTVNEQFPVDQEFYHEFLTQSDTESPTSTVPLDETSSCETARITIKPDCGDNDRRTRVPSRSLREVTTHDYAYRAYKEAMDAATAAPSKSRRRKPGLGKRAREPTDLDSILVRIRLSRVLILNIK
jgi:hypothetical protein